MDEEPPVFLAYQPYKGPASIPHAPGEFFGAFFLGINVSAAAATAGRLNCTLIEPCTIFSCFSQHTHCIQRPSSSVT
jgi:hypothetical protein